MLILIDQRMNLPSLQTITYLGIRLDSVKATLSIPEETRQKLTGVLQKYLPERRLRLKQMASIAGMINFYSQAAPGLIQYKVQMERAMGKRQWGPNPWRQTRNQH